MTICVKSFSLLLCLATLIENINDIKLYVCISIRYFIIIVFINLKYTNQYKYVCKKFELFICQYLFL